MLLIRKLLFRRNSVHLLREELENLEAIVPDLIIMETLPELDLEFENPTSSTLLIIEDQYKELTESSDYYNLFVHGSRKAKISIIISAQNAFLHSRFALSIRRNVNYIIYVGSFGDQSSVLHLGRSVFAENPNILKKCLYLLRHANIPNEPICNYVLIDLHNYHNESPLTQQFRIRSYIFPDDNFQIVFILC